MATTSQWLHGARPRTLPAALSPVLVGTGAAAAIDAMHVGRALLALVVSVALQIGVNFANDYSDGIRGTDDDRVGPFRLVGSGAASASAVKKAAFGSFGVAAVSGLILVILAGQWWLLAVGAAAVTAAWYYTGGDRPYGYRGFGELSVFVFFGLVAVVGTTYVQAGEITAASVVAGAAVGSFACALLLINNIRDAPTDAESGKRTLAVHLGQRRSRFFFLALMGLPFLLSIAVIALTGPWAALALLALPFAAATTRPVLRGDRGRDLIPVLQATSLAGLAYAVCLTVGLFLS